MSSQRLFTGSLIGWPSAVLIALAARMTFLSTSLTGAESAAWVFAGCAPLVIGMFFLRNRTGDTVAQVLYNTEQVSHTRNTRPVSRG